MDPTLKFYPIEGNSQLKFDGSNAESNEVTTSIAATQAGIERRQEDVIRSRDDMTNLGKTTPALPFSRLPQEPSFLLQKTCSKGLSQPPPAPPRRS